MKSLYIEINFYLQSWEKQNFNMYNNKNYFLPVIIEWKKKKFIHVLCAIRPEKR